MCTNPVLWRAGAHKGGRRALHGLALVLVLAACSSGDPFEPLPQPAQPPLPTTSTTAPPDFSGVALAPVEGTTTTTEPVIGPGPSTLAGRVDGPEGPVEGAVVHLERLVGDAVATLEVTTGPYGGWRAPEVLGGRYRVRAWRAPDLAMIEPQILFVEAGRTVELALVVERFRASAVDTAVAPDPPPVGVPVNLLVRASSQVVGDDGVVRATPEAGVPVTLQTGAGWDATSPLRATTDATGAVTFTLVCRAPGPQPLMVTLPPAAPAPPATTTPADAQPDDPPPTSTTVPAPPGAPEVFNLEVPDCVPPPPPTTATPAPSAPTTTEGS